VPGKAYPNMMLAGTQTFVSDLMFGTKVVGLAIGVSKTVFIETSKHKVDNGREQIFIFIHVLYQ
jgi:hypothetical protein